MLSYSGHHEVYSLYGISVALDSPTQRLHILKGHAFSKRESSSSGLASISCKFADLGNCKA